MLLRKKCILTVHIWMIVHVFWGSPRGNGDRFLLPYTVQVIVHTVIVHLFLHDGQEHKDEVIPVK